MTCAEVTGDNNVRQSKCVLQRYNVTSFLMMRKTWWHFSHSRLSVSYFALYALTKPFISRQLYNKVIFPLSTTLSHRQSRVRYFLDSPWLGSWLCVADLSGWCLCRDWGPGAAGHPAPWPGHQTQHQPEKAKCPQIVTDRARAELNGFYWIAYRVFITPIPLITWPYPCHDRLITELSIEIITHIRSESEINPFTFPRSEGASNVGRVWRCQPSRVLVNAY